MPGFQSFAGCIFVVALFVMPARLAFAQNTGSMSGMVQDPSGSRVPGANITTTNLETNAKYGTVSTELGAFSFPSLLAGYYALKVEMPGFATAEVPKVVVDVGLNAPVKVPLE